MSVMGELLGTSTVKSSFTAPSPANWIKSDCPTVEKRILSASGNVVNSAESAVILPVICNGPMIAIKTAKNRALRQDVAADMYHRKNINTSNIPPTNELCHDCIKESSTK